MNNNKKEYDIIRLAFITAIICTVYIFESWIMRIFPIPFIRIGLSNVILLLMLLDGNYTVAVIMNILKSLIGGIFTFTLLQPGTFISILSGFVAICVMYIAIKSKIGFSIIGLSIVGSVFHNISQIIIVQQVIIKTNEIYQLIPLLLSMSLVSGIITGIITALFSKRVGNLCVSKNI